MKTTKTYIFTVILFILCAISCNRTSKSYDGEYIKEGILEYDIVYSGKKNIPVMALPKKMICSFNDSSFKASIAGGIGSFKIDNIYNGSTCIFYTTVELFGHNLYTDSDEPIEFSFFDEGDVELIKTGKFKLILGYNCEMYYALFEGQIDTCEVYFTNELKIEKSNLGTPFKDIKGVLMQFTVFQGDMVLDFYASKITEQELEEDCFEVPDDFSRISKESFERNLSKLMAN